MKQPVPQLARPTYFNPDEDVAIVSHLVEGPTTFHIHDFFEIVYVEEGSLLHRHGPDVFAVAAGDVFIVNPHIPHRYDLVDGSGPPAGAHIWNLILTEAALSPLTQEPILTGLISQVMGHAFGPLSSMPVRLTDEERQIVDSVIKTMEREYLAKKDGYRTMLHGCASIVLTTIGRAMARAARPSAVSVQYATVAGVIRDIMNNCDQQLRVKELARETGWSPGHLNRVIKKATGDTASEYIGRARATKAAQLLLTTDWSVEQVAVSVGYGNARSFRRAFQRYYQKTPGVFRSTN